MELSHKFELTENRWLDGWARNHEDYFPKLAELDISDFLDKTKVDIDSEKSMIIYQHGHETLKAPFTYLETFKAANVIGYNLVNAGIEISLSQIRPKPRKLEPGALTSEIRGIEAVIRMEIESTKDEYLQTQDKGNFWHGYHAAQQLALERCANQIHDIESYLREHYEGFEGPKGEFLKRKFNVADIGLSK